MGPAFDFTGEHWPSLLLALVPALLNVFVIGYVALKLPRNKLTTYFTLTVLCLTGWQLVDVFLRASATAETAQLWAEALWIAVLMVTPVGLHFSLIFTEREKYLQQPWMLAALYVPPIFFELAILLDISPLQIVSDPFWNFTVLPTMNGLIVAQYVWVSMMAILISALLLTYTFENKPGTKRYKQSFLIAIGFIVPTVQGSITQVLMPYFFDASDIPITSSFMSSFSIIALVALTRFHLFKFSPKHAAHDILSTMNDALCVVNRNNQIYFANQSFCDLTGYSKEELYEKEYQDLLTQESYDHYLAEVSKVKAYEQEGQFELKVKDRSGGRKWVIMNITPYQSSKHEELGFIKIHTDITTLKKYIQELKSKTEELSTFFYRTGHDLRGPLASILGLINHMEGDLPENDQLLPLVNMLDESAKKLDLILDELINVANITEGPIEAEEFDVKSLVEDIVWTEKETCPKTVELSVEDKMSIAFSSDKYLLTSIIHHLVKNAIQFNDKSDVKIKVKLESKSESLIMRFADNGPGIAEKMRPHVFKMFYRGSQGKSGSGLGLYVIKKAVEKLNGSIDIESCDTGCCFILVIPTISRQVKASSYSLQ